MLRSTATARRGPQPPLGACARAVGGASSPGGRACFGASPRGLALAAAAARAVAAAGAAGLVLPARVGDAIPGLTTKPCAVRDPDPGRAWSDSLLCSPVSALPPVLLPPAVIF